MTQIAELLGSPLRSDRRITGWTIDTRTLAPGDLFFALHGPNHDGNDYVQDALARGAAAAVAERPSDGPVMLVPDTLQALQHIASWARIEWGGDVVGITGSAGKTSTKDIISAILRAGFRVGKTVGNFNNHLGVPISILRLPADAEIAVLEIGMNHAGEIRNLCRIARPRIGVVTNVGYAHIENFESLDGIAAAKRELVEALPDDGIAILNADDLRVATFRHCNVITFGLRSDADIRAEDIQFACNHTRFRVQGIEFQTPLSGRHAILNILAGIAVASCYGIHPEEVRDVVASLAPGKMRGERFSHRGIQILNDCYNSNPDAVRSMIDVLRDIPARRRIAVLGEMLELGRWSECLHRDIGSYIAQCGIDVLVGIRGAARHMVDGAIGAGLASNAAFFFDDAPVAGENLRSIAREGDVVLFKGSRGTRVEQALERFLQSTN